MEYDFELKFRLPPDAAKARDLVERLGEAGCDDAIIGTGQPGRLAMQFTREAGSARSAIVSALKDVRKVVPDAELIEVCPDFAGLTDVAECVGVTRQNMRKLMLTNAATFPAPVHEGSAAFWHLSLVLQWLKARCGYPIEQSLLDVAYIAMQVNLAKENGQLDAPFHREVRTLVI